MAGGAITGDADMGKIRRRCEPRHCMADVAILAGGQVICILDQPGRCHCRSGQETADVASLATIRVIGVHVTEKPVRRRKSTAAGVDVAGQALVDRRNMERLLADRADRDVIGIAAVATFAVVGNARVAEVRHLPERDAGGVTHAAILADRQMSPGFAVERVAGRVEVAVVARHAIVRIDVQVIERRRPAGEVRRVVAVGAVLVRTQRGRKMARQLAASNHIVMAVCALIGRCEVTRPMRKHTGAKGARGMADTAILAGRQVVGMHARRFSDQARMASGLRTVGGDTGVIEG